MNRPSFLRYRRWPLLALAFGALLSLIGLSGEIVRRNTNRIYGEMERVQRSYHESDRALNEVRSQMYVLAIVVRDYLLDPSEPAGGEQRRQMFELHASMVRGLDQVERHLGPEERKIPAHLREALREYWNSMEPIFNWTAAQKRALGAGFLRRHVVPYRTSVMSMASEIEELVSKNLSARQAASRRAQQQFQKDLGLLLASTIGLGLLIAGASIARMVNLERRAEHLRLQTEQHRQELRGLSQKLVRAQEEERKSISRELHDQIGQMLTALRMEFGNLDSLRDSPGDEFSLRLKEGKTLAEQTLRVVRDLAMGLRPSMLDDLGLAPAVEWQAREFTRHTGIPVDVQIDGNLAGLPEGPRICIYRVVQEALTNCARHAQAKDVRITLHGRGGGVSLTVQDDGKGFDVRQEGGRGVGLIGIEERVRELEGTVSIISQPQKGTLVRVEVPFKEEARA